MRAASGVHRGGRQVTTYRCEYCQLDIPNPREHFTNANICKVRPMIQPEDPSTGQPSLFSGGITLPGWSHPLRKAAAETLLAGALALADIARASPNCNNGWTDAMKATEERFRKALEQLAEALS